MPPKKLNKDIQPKKKESPISIKKEKEEKKFSFEILSYFHKNPTLFVITALTGIISGILALSSWYAFASSDYIDFIPDNTQQFVHIDSSSTPASLLDTVLPVFSLKTDYALQAQKLKIPFITFVKTQNNTEIFFLENISKGTAKKFLQSFTTVSEELDFKKENKLHFVEVKQGKALICAYEERTLFCGKEKELVADFLQKEKLKTLDHKKAVQNIRNNSEIIWYSKGESLPFPLFKAQKDAIESVYISWDVRSETLIQTQAYALTKQDFSPAERKEWSKNTLSSLFPKNSTIAFLSGYDFSKQWLHTEAQYEKSSPEYTTIMRGILRKQVSDIFGAETDFYKDILPLFQKHFAVALVQDSKSLPQLTFVSESTTMNDVEVLLQKFYENRGRFTVEKKSVPVDEKTVLESVYSDESKMKKIQERIGNSQVIGYEVTGKPYGFYASQKENTVLISSSKEVLKNLLQPEESPQLAESLPHSLKNAYEFGFVSFEEINKAFSFLPFQFPKMELLSHIKNISWESESFPGGISLSGNIVLKD